VSAHPHVGTAARPAAWSGGARCAAWSGGARCAAWSGGSVYGPGVTLRLVGSGIVHLDKDTFMWVQLTHFSLDPSLDDGLVLGGLIASRGYVHDYASPFNAEAPLSEPALHGRWYRHRIEAEMFEPWSASDAEAVIQDWAENQEWTEPGCRQPPEVHARLAPVYNLLRAGSVYKLRDPGENAEHEYGWVTGNLGFHEFVIIDRTAERLHVIVASDD
jgi:hypothetical protein